MWPRPPASPDAAPVRLIARRVKPTPRFQPTGPLRHLQLSRLQTGTGNPGAGGRSEVENARPEVRRGAEQPSGRFAANAAWLAIQVTARWTARTGLGELVTTKTLRRRFFSLAGRTRSARRLTLLLPGKPNSSRALPDCEPSGLDGAGRDRATHRTTEGPRKLAPPWSARVPCCVFSHHPAVAVPATP